MFTLALRTLRHRTGGFVAAFVAAFLGAVIVSACAGLMETGIRSDTPPHRLAWASAVVSGKPDFELRKSAGKPKTQTVVLPERVRLDRSMADQIRATPGVSAVVGEVNFPISLGKQPLTAHGWESARLPGPALRADEVVLPASTGAKVGSTVDLAVRGSIGRYRVARTSGQPDAFFADDVADQLSGHPGKVDYFGVVTDNPAALRLGADVSVLTGDERGLAEFPEAQSSGARLIPLAGSMGGLSLAVAVFVIASTLMLSVRQRQRELALLRAIGTTPRQLRRMVLGEALVIGVLATGAAAAAGPLFGGWLFGNFTSGGFISPAVQYHQGWLPMLVAAGATLLAVGLSALVAGFRVGRIRPTEALAEAAVPRRWLTPARLIVAALCFAGGTALAIVTLAVMTGPIAASTAGPAVLLWAIGVAMISPGVTKLTAIALHGPVRLISGVTGWLAITNTRNAAIRVAGAVTPIMLAVGIATANMYLQTTTTAAAQESFAEDLRADAVLSGPTGISPETLDRARRADGVAAASPYLLSRGFITEPFDDNQTKKGYPAIGLTDASTNAATVVRGDLAHLTGDTIALPDTAEVSRSVGESVTLRLGDGTERPLRIVAIVHQRPDAEQLLLPADLLAAHTTAGLPRQVLVRAAPGVDQARLAQSLTAATAGLPVTVGDRATLTAAAAKNDETGVWVNYLLVGMVVGYTVISVVNTLVMATSRRRREFGLQRLGGFTRGQVLRMAGAEGGLIAAIGVLLGTVVSAGAIVPFSLVATGRVLPTGPLAIYLVIVAAAVTLALVAAVGPAWVATRARPVTVVATGE
ncbi:ABC transporter permease [Amycolatopsis benzoatilytica]|uniref:ABC transporter permease n=1 Tax=Amycolatopsis benzoatilytica TaxID=346045 RepID=UPI0003734D33|nr:ABC transporter permease [Amycolatopsis benzoatilytica]